MAQWMGRNKPDRDRTSERIIITGGIILLPDGLKRADLEIVDGVISTIEAHIVPGHPCQIVNAEGRYILPGFIDIHTNGIAGFDLTSGVYDRQKKSFTLNEEAYISGLDQALREYARRGTTRVVLSSLASPLEELKRAFSYVRTYNARQTNAPWASVLGGLYVEGTFMKLSEYSGAHNPDYFHEPSEQLFDELQDAAGGLIRIVNVVPEWGEPALRLIQHISSSGNVCAAGHTGATGSQYCLARRSGTKLAVHFLNGPTGTSFKSFDGGGAVESVLRADDLFVEIIADGYHVDKSYVLDTISRKGVDQVVVITDSMFTANFPDMDEFKVYGVGGKVSADRKFVEDADKPNTLFGSMLTMDVAFSNVINWLTAGVDGVWVKRHESIGLDSAIARASEMCSKNPARVLGIFEPASVCDDSNLSGFTGSLESGKLADLLIASLELSEGKYRLNVERVYVGGKMI